MIVDPRGERARLPDPELDLSDDALELLGDALAVKLAKAGWPVRSIAKFFNSTPSEWQRRLSTVPAEARDWYEASDLPWLVEELAEAARWAD